MPLIRLDLLAGLSGCSFSLHLTHCCDINILKITFWPQASLAQGHVVVCSLFKSKPYGWPSECPSFGSAMCFLFSTSPKMWDATCQEAHRAFKNLDPHGKKIIFFLVLFQSPWLYRGERFRFNSMLVVFNINLTLGNPCFEQREGIFSSKYSQ